MATAGISHYSDSEMRGDHSPEQDTSQKGLTVMILR